MSMNGYQTSCLIHGAKQIVQIVSNKARYVRGVENMKSVAVLEENSDKGDLMLVSIGYKKSCFFYLSKIDFCLYL